METLLPLFFVALLATFAVMLAICLRDMVRLARSADRRAVDQAQRQGRARKPSGSDNLAFRKRHRD